MSDKITITESDLTELDRRPSDQDAVREKIVLCEMAPAPPAKPQRELPAIWYLASLLPALGVIAVICGCFQRKFKFTYQVPAAISCILSTLIPVLLFVGAFSKAGAGGDWKNELARKAPRGVVFVTMETRERSAKRSGIGTGVVVAKHGDEALVLTNRHVVCTSNGELAETVTVLTSSKTRLPTDVVALPIDGDIDMALLRVGDARHLEVLGDIGDFAAVKTGDDVVAIGHPNGLSFTMTQGIVSGLRKGMLIQSSASINPGNSGGPLLNSRGQVIGINTFFIKNSQGLNFAFRADFILERSQWRYMKNIDGLLKAITKK